MNYQTYQLSNLNTDQIASLCGPDHINFKELTILYDTDITFRNSQILFFSENIELFDSFCKHMDYLVSMAFSGEEINRDLIAQSFQSIHSSIDPSWQKETAGYNFGGKPIRFKTYHQYQMMRAIKDNDLLFAIGPAGTGKTYLAVLSACTAYKKGEIKKIILTRPAVEAGESLGFLPGDLKEKVDPYLMPLYDSLYDILGEEQVEKMIDKNAIEVIPLAYMRGRTLDDAYIILDEAQNTTQGQMLMFLTRLGKYSKMIVNGDVSQIDLNISKTKSGLISADEKLQDIPGISFIRFEKGDVVRHPLVEKIIERFAQ